MKLAAIAKGARGSIPLLSENISGNAGIGSRLVTIYRMFDGAVGACAGGSKGRAAKFGIRDPEWG
jgi:hypothetical protein